MHMCATISSFLPQTLASLLHTRERVFWEGEADSQLPEELTKGSSAYPLVLLGHWLRMDTLSMNLTAFDTDGWLVAWLASSFLDDLLQVETESNSGKGEEGGPAA